MWYRTGTGSDNVAESDARGTPTPDSVFFGGKRIARIDADGTVKYYFSDHLGSASVVTNENGSTIRDESDYHPFGGERPITVADSNHYEFTGKERDSVAENGGLDYFGARYYRSGASRWMSPDWSAAPVAVPYADLSNPQALNLYAYVGNRPTVVIDPDGHGEPPPPQTSQPKPGSTTGPEPSAQPTCSNKGKCDHVYLQLVTDKAGADGTGERELVWVLKGTDEEYYVFEHIQFIGSEDPEKNKNEEMTKSVTRGGPSSGITGGDAGTGVFIDTQMPGTGGASGRFTQYFTISKDKTGAGGVPVMELRDQNGKKLKSPVLQGNMVPSISSKPGRVEIEWLTPDVRERD